MAKLSSGGVSKKVSYYGTSGNDIISSDADNIYGDPAGKRSGNDVIYGSNKVQSIFGGGGNDWINGGGGFANTTYVEGDYATADADALDGGAGSDWVSFQPNSVNHDAYSAGVAVNLDAGTYSFDTGATFPDGLGGDVAIVADGTLAYFENVWGSEAADNITGDAGENDLVGGAGADQINGLGGNDEIEGGAGNDTLTGGDGSDTFEFAASLEQNGVDTITDLQLCADAGDVDVLDLSDALGGVTFGVVDGPVISDYVKIVENGAGGADLLVDVDGTGTASDWEVWAHLDGVFAGSEVPNAVQVYTGSSFTGCVEVQALQLTIA